MAPPGAPVFDTDVPAFEEPEPSTVVAQAVEPPSPRTDAPDGAPNILFLVWDTTRADRMSLYGHSRVTTPRLDDLSSESVVFEHAIAPSFWTVPSHASMFTGMPASVHRANAHSTWLQNRFVTLAEHLRDGGWDTWMFTANPNLSRKTNLIQGFETVLSQRQDVFKERAIALTDAKLVADDRSTERSPAWDGDGNKASKDIGPLMEETLLAWLDERPTDRPWFAFLNYMEVHGPRLPTLASRSDILDAEEVALGLSTKAGFKQVGDANHGRLEFGAAERDAMLGVYDAALRELDATTGSLLDSLATRGVLDDTLVVLVSDHGEGFGEHGFYGHNYNLYDELVHVPLLLRYPAALSPQRIERPVSIRDVFRTVIELAGLPLPETVVPVQGLLDEPHPVFAELVAFHGSKPGLKRVRPDGSWIPLRRRFQVVVDGSWKLIRASDGDNELYDLATDPRELTNRVATAVERAATMEETLAAWKASHPGINRAKLSKRERRQKREAGGDVPLEELEALGYVQGDH